tara:strand:+ start:10182 stop:10313 length:132 start_codon:yes stop_codon:yes gene_type:complete
LKTQDNQQVKYLQKKMEASDHFKNGDFYSGIKKGVIELIEKWK